MKKFTLFNIKWHPIRFVFLIFATEIVPQAMWKWPRDCKMQPARQVLLKKRIYSPEELRENRSQPWNIFKKILPVLTWLWCVTWMSVGDEVAAIVGSDTILTHSHLVIDGDAADGTAGIHQGIEVGVATRTHRVKVVGTDRQGDVWTDLDRTCQVVCHGPINAHHDQHAAKSGIGVDIVGEI